MTRKGGRRQRYGADGVEREVELASLAITDSTGKGDFHGDVDAVRRANMEDPHRKIREGPPTVSRNGRSRWRPDAASYARRQALDFQRPAGDTASASRDFPRQPRRAADDRPRWLLG